MCLSRSYACKAASLPLGLLTINMSFFLNILRSLISNIYSSDMDRNVDTWIDSGFDDSKLLSCNLNATLAAAKDWMIRHEQIAAQGRAMSTRLHHRECSLCLQAEEEAIKDSDQKDIWNDLFAASRQTAEFSVCIGSPQSYPTALMNMLLVIPPQATSHAPRSRISPAVAAQDPQHRATSSRHTRSELASRDRSSQQHTYRTA
jgi:hypothetical protein